MSVDRKQIMLLIFSLAAFAFLGYQIYLLVSGDLAQVPPSSRPAAATTKPAPPAAPVSVAPKTTAAETPSPRIIKVARQLPQKFVAQQPALLKTQQSYVQLVNQYELAKMQRQLLQEKVSIAKARQTLITIQKNNNANDGSHVSINANGDSLPEGDSTSRYQLRYLDQQSGTWSAVLGSGNSFENVVVGSVLPNQAKVIKISARGVIVAAKNQLELLTFNGTRKLVRPAKPPQKKQMIVTKPAAVSVTVNRLSGVTAQAIDWREAALLHLPATAPVQAKQIWRDTASHELKYHTSNANKVSLDLGLPAITINPEVHNVLSTSSLLEPIHRSSNIKAIVSSVLKKSAQPYKISRHYTADEQRLLHMNANDYTIQLLRSQYQFVAQDFIQAHHLSKKSAWFVENYDKKPGYVVLYGDYPSLAQAKLAKQQLPPQLNPQGKLTIRRLAAIQHDIISRSSAT